MASIQKNERVLSKNNLIDSQTRKRQSQITIILRNGIFLPSIICGAIISPIKYSGMRTSTNCTYRNESKPKLIEPKIHESTTMPPSKIIPYSHEDNLYKKGVRKYKGNNIAINHKPYPFIQYEMVDTLSMYS